MCQVGAEDEAWEALTTAHQKKTQALQAVENVIQKAKYVGLIPVM